MCCNLRVFMTPNQESNYGGSQCVEIRAFVKNRYNSSHKYTMGDWNLSVNPNKRIISRPHFLDTVPKITELLNVVYRLP